ncbi:prephenate dehydrogenase [Methanosphaera cuniculi]|uniref:prephenate dehydrogenase n=1 Tax=Methanosphaera cuniculi TaxID=1077256 RepID=UPI0026F11979|nr:prephenate dehydrogenase [Methanosphaera cuniculi]
MTCNENIKISIIGGTRGLGKWIAQELKKDNFNITITSRNKTSGEKVAKKLKVNYTDDNIKAVKNSDITIFSVPIEYMVDTIRQVAPHAPKGSLLVDVTSVKTETAETLTKYAPDNVNILPTHPMFGPRITSLDGQVVILTPIAERCDIWYEKVLHYLNKKGAKIVISTPQEHDKTMSVVQGLTHFSYISIASTIQQLQISVKKSREFASPVYSLMLDMISRIVSQNPYLYYSIQKSNPKTQYARGELIKQMQYLSDLINNNEEEEFVKNMSSSARYLDEYEEALGRSDKAISILTDDFKRIKNSIGSEIGLQHQYSGNVHIGKVINVDSDNVTILDLRNNTITLKISNVTIMSDDEIYQWKVDNLPIYNYDISVILPISCNEEVLLDMFSKIEPIIRVELKDVYAGKQIKDGFMSYTFSYSVFNKSDKQIVEDYILGIGGIIR